MEYDVEKAVTGEAVGLPRCARERCRGVIARAWGDRSGTTAVEFALIAPVLFMLLMGTIETSFVFAADMMLKNATQTAARTGRTGFVETESTQAQTILAQVRDKASVLMDPAKLAITSKAYQGFDGIGKPEPFTDANGNGKRDDGENYDDLNGNGKYDLDRGVDGYGGAKQVVLYTVTYPWTFFTPLIGDLFSSEGVLTLEATAVVQNEPY